MNFNTPQPMKTTEIINLHKPEFTATIENLTKKEVTAVRSTLTKYLNFNRNELNDRLEAQKKGWNEYLGEWIVPQINLLKREIQRLETRQRNISVCNK